MMPLTLADNGEELIIRRVGGLPEVKRHLEDLGFVVGESVRIISRIGGNVIVVVKDTRLAIDQTMAEKIMV
ncbi:MAG: ferrous iron transport protein A [Oscillospiraceae bacterium]|nr:ferrous iron transport protein A [Oscillospiraceae bacterium]